jgi:hypothetical protein
MTKVRKDLLYFVPTREAAASALAKLEGVAK